MTTIYAAVFAAGLAGTFALIGAYVGARTQRKAWLREHRLQCAAELLTSADQVLARMLEAPAPERRREIYDRGVDDLIDHPARARLILVGNSRTESMIRQLIGTLASADADSERDTEYGRVRRNFVQHVRGLIHA